MSKANAVLAANIFAGLVTVLWAGLLWFDILLMRNMARYQHQWGYPDAADTRHYIVLPTCILVVLLAAIIVFNFKMRSPGLLAILAFIMMFECVGSILFAAAA